MIRVSQWAEIRQMFYADAVTKKEIARRFGLDVKTVRRALERDEPPVCRRSPARSRRLDPWRLRIEAWLQEDRKLTAKRIRTLLLPLAGPVPSRTVRQYVARVWRSLPSSSRRLVGTASAITEFWHLAPGGGPPSFEIAQNALRPRHPHLPASRPSTRPSTRTWPRTWLSVSTDSDGNEPDSDHDRRWTAVLSLAERDDSR